MSVHDEGQVVIDEEAAEERLRVLYARARERGLPEPVYQEIAPDEREIIARLDAQDAPVAAGWVVAAASAVAASV